MWAIVAAVPGCGHLNKVHVIIIVKAAVVGGIVLIVAVDGDSGEVGTTKEWRVAYKLDTLRNISCCKCRFFKGIAAYIHYRVRSILVGLVQLEC